MGPLRILLLAALLYIGYRLISANFKKSSDEQKEDSADDSASSTGETVNGTITDVLIEDPVCRKLVPQQQAYTIELGGETHHFCSKECADAFAAGQEENDR